MRLMLAGLPLPESKELMAAVADIVDNGGILPDWAELERAVEQTRPDVVAVYLGARPGQVLAQIRRVRAMFPAAQYVAIADQPDRSIVQSVRDTGCADLVVLEECPDDLRRALRVISTREQAPTADGIITAILGAKGGVGTTVVAANLAAELARRGDRRVILVDLHLFLGDAAVVLDVRPRPSTVWFLQRGSVADGRTWAEAPPKHKAGFRVLGLDGDVAAVDPVTAEQVVFLIDRLRERFDHVLIDCGSEVNEVSLAACSSAHERLIILTDDLAARTGAQRRVQAFKALDLGAIPAKAIINRSPALSESAIATFERTIGIPPVATVANAWKDMQAALERGQVLRQTAPRTAAVKDFSTLADTLAGTRDQEQRKRTFFNFFR